MLKYDKTIKIETNEKLSPEILNFLKNFNHLIFNSFFNKSIDNLPLSITKLELGDHFKQSLDFLPINLEELSVKKITQQQVNNLPINLKVLNLRYLEEEINFNKIEIISLQDFNSIENVKNKIYRFYPYLNKTYFLLQERKRDGCQIYIFKDVKIKNFIKENPRFYFDLQDGDLILETGGYNRRLFIVSDKLGQKEIIFFDDENHYTRDFDFTNLPDNFNTFEKFPIYYWEKFSFDKVYSNVKILNLERLFHYYLQIKFNKTYCQIEEEEDLIKVIYPHNEFYIYCKNEKDKTLFQKFYLMNNFVSAIKPQKFIFEKYPDKQQIVEFYP